MGGLDIKWSVGLAGTKSIMDTPLARMALERGGHLHVGLEEFHGDRQPTNAELVSECVALAETAGRPVASCSTAAKILGLPKH